MPRTYIWEDEEHNPNDFCKDCFFESGFDDEDEDDHPDYDDTGYTCDRCGKELTAEDN